MSEWPDVDESAFQRLEEARRQEKESRVHVETAAEIKAPFRKPPLSSTASLAPGQIYTMKSGATNSAWGQGAGAVILHESFSLDAAALRASAPPLPSRPTRVDNPELDSDPVIQSVLDIYRFASSCDLLAWPHRITRRVCNDCAMSSTIDYACGAGRSSKTITREMWRPSSLS